MKKLYAVGITLLASGYGLSFVAGYVATHGKGAWWAYVVAMWDLLFSLGLAFAGVVAIIFAAVDSWIYPGDEAVDALERAKR